MLTALVDQAKTAAAALGVGGTFLGAYVSLGLPLPASQPFVESKVAAVVAKIDASDATTGKKIDGLSATVLELQRKAITTQKARLRFEAGANAALSPKADAARRVTLERRSAEIQDELADLDRDDEGLRLRIEKLRLP
jgi:hypothetical protein